MSEPRGARRLLPVLGALVVEEPNPFPSTRPSAAKAGGRDGRPLEAPGDAEGSDRARASGRAAVVSDRRRIASDQKLAEPDDPLALVGVAVPVDEATFDAMAEVFIDEFVRDGWPDDRLLSFFRSPFYAGLHVIWRRRGEAWVRGQIAAARARWHRSADGRPERSRPDEVGSEPGEPPRGHRSSREG